MLKRKIDRLLVMMAPPSSSHDILQDFTDHIHEAQESDGEIDIDLNTLLKFRSAYVAEDIFIKILENAKGDDGTVLAEIRDLRRYLILVEAEMVARGGVKYPPLDAPNLTLTGITRHWVETHPATTGGEVLRALSEGLLTKIGSNIHEGTEATLRQRIDALDRRIANAKQWGAALTAMDEERSALRLQLTDLLCESGRPVIDRLEDGVNEYEKAPYATVFLQDPISGAWFKNADRRMMELKKEQWDHLPRLRTEINYFEWKETLPEYRGLYARNESSEKYVMREEFRECWGKEN